MDDERHQAMNTRCANANEQSPRVAWKQFNFADWLSNFRLHFRSVDFSTSETDETSHLALGGGNFWGCSNYCDTFKKSRSIPAAKHEMPLYLNFTFITNLERSSRRTI